MADQVIQCSQACTVTVQHEFAFPVLSLTTEEGAAIGGRPPDMGSWLGLSSLDSDAQTYRRKFNQ